jgi:hypothetical protein
MNRIDVCNLIVSIVNASARRYSSLKSETPLAKNYLKLHGSAQALSTSIPGLKTEQLEKKYILLDKKFVAIEQQYKDMYEKGLVLLDNRHYASHRNETEEEKVTKNNAAEIQVKVPDQGQATLQLSRGGKRDGAGRKKKEGITVRKLSLALPDGWWTYIDSLKKGSKLSQSEILHNLLIPVLAIASNDANKDFIKSDAAVYELLEKYLKK